MVVVMDIFYVRMHSFQMQAVLLDLHLEGI